MSENKPLGKKVPSNQGSRKTITLIIAVLIILSVIIVWGMFLPYPEGAAIPTLGKFNSCIQEKMNHTEGYPLGHDPSYYAHIECCRELKGSWYGSNGKGSCSWRRI